ncbi:peptidoglycan -binding protein [Candidatus Endoriftia persephonae]|jgi:chemotaxis protein MotB|uniref:Flagellar motor rotation protein MotB n=2 Tax=Gammaproteobacteria TaxID=1236 RepID=G2FJ18_9GAMM|nr:peptidoglycan -binding protein [Candidatus Endoriftia persephone]EGW53220.1 flagellar motor rotation protein MotB [endosymbiont of Tevnia jerichonana (vent Tica)]USF87146.1 peptidoglycan -binding protein [Candidatus Endoriftia persephone]
MFTSARRSRHQINVWPGYVDALSALLILVIFVILIFTFAQFLLSQILSNQESELANLNQQIAALSHDLGLERTQRASLEQDVNQLSGMISELTDEKFQLSSQIGQLTTQGEADQKQIEQQLLNIASLQQDIATLQAMRQKLEQEVGQLASNLQQKDEALGQLRDRGQSLQAELADQQERTLLAQQQLQHKEINIQALNTLVGLQREAINKERRLSEEAQIEVAALSQKIGLLRSQLQEISAALKLSKQEKTTQQNEIKRLGERLNIELARQVNQLEQYRSEFFGRLRTLLGDNPAVRIVGDRFLFQSELLFASGSARLGAKGKAELTKLAVTLKQVATRIPKEINWILRIDGHTDRLPIHTEQFPSNWELSSARAVSVVRYLASQGIPQRRLTAAGFGEFHPIDTGDTPEALSHNRRIEIKLTSL